MKTFIMGMHRSGTSLMTGALSLCGLYVGNNLLSGARDNPRGHFEDRRFLNINNQILIRNGGSWKAPPLALGYAGQRDKMSGFLRLPDWRGRDRVGWKDPRICLTFPLWHELYYPEVTRIVWMSRSKNAIAASLKARNGFTKRRSFELIDFYQRNALAHVHRRGVKYMIADFDSFFNEYWETQLQAVCEFLDLEFPKNTKKLRAFIEPKLRHHRRELVK